jgi:CTP:molybdopterin cytidylyltransferase MocA
MGFPKALLASEGKLIVERMVEDLRQSGWGSSRGCPQPRTGIVFSSVWLSELFHKLLTDVAIIINRNPEAGMISSIRLALAWAEEDAEGLLTLPVDHPLVASATYAAIRTAVVHDRIVIPTFSNRRGHPTWWGRDYWELLNSSVADGGAHGILHSSGVNVVELPVEDEGVLININTPADAAEHGLRKMAFPPEGRGERMGVSKFLYES